jgi:hypothetical protein
MENNKVLILTFIRKLNVTYHFHVLSTDTIGSLKPKVLNKLNNSGYNEFIDFDLWELEAFHVQEKVNDNDIIGKFDYFEFKLVKKKKDNNPMQHCSL